MTADTKENTLRRLQGKDPIQKLRCRLGWHRWTSWETVRGHEYLSELAKCHCADCGMPRVEYPYSKSKTR